MHTAVAGGGGVCCDCVGARDTLPLILPARVQRSNAFVSESIGNLDTRKLAGTAGVMCGLPFSVQKAWRDTPHACCHVVVRVFRVCGHLQFVVFT